MKQPSIKTVPEKAILSGVTSYPQFCVSPLDGFYYAKKRNLFDSMHRTSWTGFQFGKK
jgi:hypothetical protein